MNAQSTLRSFPPRADDDALVLILGSMPGVESLRKGQYYAFPRNAFWKIMGALLGFDPAIEYEERLRVLRNRGIALWDSLGACRRKGSLDSDIVDPEPNDIPALLAQCPRIRLILCNGTASCEHLRRAFPELFRREGLRILRMPSTSPAAAMFSFEKKLAAYRDALRSVIAGIP